MILQRIEGDIILNYNNNNNNSDKSSLCGETRV